MENNNEKRMKVKGETKTLTKYQQYI